MCGFSGIFRWDGKRADPELLKKMNHTLIHRGPDDEGTYFSSVKNPENQVQVGLGFRRLAIIDLSSGHQPMSTAKQNNWIVFNGEIYNFLELRKDLENRGCKFLTRSDTEVILHLYELYGSQCVRYLRGMFAFAIWDSKNKTIFIARDRIGKKPLFYTKRENCLFFASELKAILEVPDVPKNINRESIPLYFAYQFIPSPHTIFKDIERIPPGHTLTCNGKGEIKIERYWRISQAPKKSEKVLDLCEELRHHLREATKIRLMSDVPLGAFLSGGIDSSAVVGMMAEEMSEPVKTFSIGFDESDFSELKFARLAADRFKTDHHEFVVKPETMELLPKLVWHYDQPFADPSALPSYMVANETRKHVTVALNGDGGDENFGGYLRYQADRIFHLLATVPKPIRSKIQTLIQGMPKFSSKNRLGRRLFRASRILEYNPYEFNFKIFCYFDQEGLEELFEPSVLAAIKNKNVYEYFDSLYKTSDSEEFLDQILFCDLNGYLPDCLLVKMDIASMANSLEARSPFLDHKLIEFAAKIPSKYKVKFNGCKWILKKALKGFLPDSILERKKMGFGVPLRHWFKGPLAPFLKETLLSAKARKRGYFRMDVVERLIKEHQNDQRDHSVRLWALLWFELWHTVYLDKN